MYIYICFFVSSTAAHAKKTHSSTHNSLMRASPLPRLENSARHADALPIPTHIMQLHAQKCVQPNGALASAQQSEQASHSRVEKDKSVSCGGDMEEHTLTHL